MDNIKIGEMAEWLKAPAWKACILLKVSRVRIPFSPPEYTVKILKFMNCRVLIKCKRQF